MRITDRVIQSICDADQAREFARRERAEYVEQLHRAKHLLAVELFGFDPGCAGLGCEQAESLRDAADRMGRAMG